MFVHANQLCFRNRLRRCRLVSVFVVTNAKYLPGVSMHAFASMSNELCGSYTYMCNVYVVMIWHQAMACNFLSFKLTHRRRSQHVYSVHCTMYFTLYILHIYIYFLVYSLFDIIPYASCVLQCLLNIHICMYCMCSPTTFLFNSILVPIFFRLFFSSVG